MKARTRDRDTEKRMCSFLLEKKHHSINLQTAGVVSKDRIL